MRCLAVRLETTFQFIFHYILFCETALHFRIMFNLGLPPFQHQTPDPCPKSYTLDLWKHISVQVLACIGLSWYIIFSLARMGINGKKTKQQLHQILECSQGEWHFTLDYSIVVIQHSPITVIFANMRNSLPKRKTHIQQVCIRYGIVLHDIT